MKRLQRILLAFTTIPIVLFGLGVGPAAAFNDSGVSPNGFNRFAYQDACYNVGDLWFQYDAYRYNADTITFQWWISGSTYGSNKGEMHIKADTAGAADNQFNDYHLGGGQVFFAHRTARLPYPWSLSWHPVSGGSCTVFTARL